MHFPGVFGGARGGGDSDGEPAAAEPGATDVEMEQTLQPEAQQADTKQKHPTPNFTLNPNPSKMRKRFSLTSDRKIKKPKPKNFKQPKKSKGWLQR